VLKNGPEGQFCESRMQGDLERVEFVHCDLAAELLCRALVGHKNANVHDLNFELGDVALRSECESLGHREAYARLQRSSVVNDFLATRAPVPNSAGKRPGQKKDPGKIRGRES
jgi:hypothetical protein